MKLRIATCQFAVDADIRRNLRTILRQMRRAKRARADVVHFSEVALSGYAGIEFTTFDGFDWDLLREATERVRDCARELKLWVVLGSSHRLTGKHKPHNSLYIIDHGGRIVDRFDKLFCTGERDEQSGDLKHYSPGSHLAVFSIKGIKCGTLICHDFRYQELYREYKKLDVRVMFHSYHNGHQKKATLARAKNIWGVIVPPTMQAYAANNYMWISSNNTSARESSWPSFFVLPDGRIANRLRGHDAGMLLNTVDTGAKFYDASEAWRDRAMRGIYHSGTLVKDKRSDDRTNL